MSFAPTKCFGNQAHARFDLEWQIKISFDNMERVSETLPDHKSWKRLGEIWLYHVLLCKSERESDFDIFGCTSECGTIRLGISLVCLICNISLLRETRCRVAIRTVSILWSSGSTGPGAVWGSDRSVVKQIYLLATMCPRGWSHFELFLWGAYMCVADFSFNRDHYIQIKTQFM